MPDLFSLLPPGILMVIGALAAPLLPQLFRQAYLLALVAMSTLHAAYLPADTYQGLSVFGLDLALIDPFAMTLPFAIVFHIAAALNIIYGMPEKSRITDTSGTLYAGAAIAALYAGDFLTLFIYWELTAISSAFLILARGTERAIDAAMRYLLVQVTSGVILLAGAAFLWRYTGTIEISAQNPYSIAGGLILVAFGIKAAFPFLNGWLQDAYPEATPSGTVILSAFTTKLSIYMLARCYAGFEPLIYVGLLMTLFPVFFAVIENDLRRVLAFSLNNQLGFMVVGIGIGTELALNGTAAHAFAHIIYKALLFMSMGAVLYRVGTVKAHALGGLYKKMPLTMIFCIIGALSISSFPLFSGFVTKSLTIGSTIKEGYLLVWFGLIFASAGVLEHSGIKIPFFTFFAHQKTYGPEVKEAPLPMLVAMAIAAGLCIFIGLFPQYLYTLLPYEVTYQAWTTSHVLSELQLLLFATLAFVFLWVRGWYPAEKDETVLNIDWLYRRGLPRLIMAIFMPLWRIYVWGLGRLKTNILNTLKQTDTTSRKIGAVSGHLSIGNATGLLIAIFALMLALGALL